MPSASTPKRGSAASEAHLDGHTRMLKSPRKSQPLLPYSPNSLDSKEGAHRGRDYRPFPSVGDYECRSSSSSTRSSTSGKSYGYRPSHPKAHLHDIVTGGGSGSSLSLLHDPDRIILNQKTLEAVKEVQHKERVLTADQKYEWHSKQAPALDLYVENPACTKLFSTEIAIGGTRRYLAAGYDRFVPEYYTTPVKCFYELIPPVPCRLYFDIECKLSENPDFDPEVDGDGFMHDLMEAVTSRMQEIHKGITAKYIDLTSTSSSKFSRHLHVHLTKDGRQLLFKDNRHAGVFVRSLVDDILSNLNPSSQTASASASNSPQMPYLKKWMLVGPDRTASMIDLGVYTRNRCFRLLHSKKYAKSKSTALFPAPGSDSWWIHEDYPREWEHLSTDEPSLTPSASSVPCQNEAPKALPLKFEPDSNIAPLKQHVRKVKALFDFSPHRETLERTLVVPNLEIGQIVDVLTADESTISLRENVEVTREFFLGGLHTPAPMTSTQVSVISQLSQTQKQHKEQISEANLPVSIHPNISSFSNLLLPSPFPLIDKYVANHLAGPKGTIGSYSLLQANPDVISYNMRGNRYCRNIGREHKSNNVGWRVNVRALTATQVCFDLDCRGFRWELTVDDPEVKEWAMEREMVEAAEAAEAELALSGEHFEDAGGIALDDPDSSFERSMIAAAQAFDEM